MSTADELNGIVDALQSVEDLAAAALENLRGGVSSRRQVGAIERDVRMIRQGVFDLARRVDAAARCSDGGLPFDLLTASDADLDCLPFGGWAKLATAAEVVLLSDGPVLGVDRARALELRDRAVELGCQPNRDSRITP